jgi:hypothetical protein
MELFIVLSCEGENGRERWPIKAFRTENRAKGYCNILSNTHEEKVRRLNELNDRIFSGSMTKDAWIEHGELCGYFDYELAAQGYYAVVSVELEE